MSKKKFMSNGPKHASSAVARKSMARAISAAVCALLLGAGLPCSVLGQTSFFCSFPNSPADCGFLEQYKGMDDVPPGPGRASIVNIGRDGPTGVLLHTEPGDNNVSGSGAAERNDLKLMPLLVTDCSEGREQWWAHSILFPDNYIAPPQSTGSSWNWGVVFDFHQTDGVAGPSNFEIQAMPDSAIYPEWPTGLNFAGAGGDPGNPSSYGAAIGPTVKNVWYDFVYHVKWSSGPDGFFSAWVNGARKLSRIGPTLYAGQSCYLKLANYHVPFGQASSVVHDRVIRSTTWDSLSLSSTLDGIYDQGTASYAGSWTTYGTETGYFNGGTILASDGTGSPDPTSTFTFSGSAVKWIGVKCNVCGIAGVSIDGGVAAVVDTAGPTAPGQITPEVVYSASGLATGVNHTITITVTGTSTSGGTYVAIDAFEVTH